MTTPIVEWAVSKEPQLWIIRPQVQHQVFGEKSLGITGVVHPSAWRAAWAFQRFLDEDLLQRRWVAWPAFMMLV